MSKTVSNTQLFQESARKKNFNSLKEKKKKLKTIRKTLENLELKIPQMWYRKTLRCLKHSMLSILAFTPNSWAGVFL